MDREQVQAWVDAYVGWWRASDVTGVAALFTPDVRYLTSPYAGPAVGHGQVSALWRDDLGRTFEVASAVVAVDGRNAVVRLQVTYLDPEPQEYRDLWVMQFADDGRVELFEEWPYVAGQPGPARSRWTPDLGLSVAEQV